MRLAARLANAAWIASSRSSHQLFANALLEPEAAQRQRLSNYLGRNAETSFGLTREFAAINGAEDYSRRIPVSTYIDSVGDFEAIGNGDLCQRTADPVTHFALTAGTGGPAKRIPYTASLKGEFSTAVSAWIVDTYRMNPAAFHGSAYWSVSPALGRCSTPGGIPVGFEEDSSYLGSGQKILIDRVLAVPGSIAGVKDVQLSRRATAALLLGHSDLRLVSVWHPSFFTILCDWIAENWSTVLSDLRDGIDLPQAGLRIPSRPSRATKLKSFRPDDPNHFWGNLSLISAWGDGTASRFLDDLGRRFPGVAIQPKGVVATEAIVSIPFRGEYPLAISSHYFEFQLEDGEVLPSWRLERGMRGSPVVTTAGGLYRYRIDDILEVTGHIGAAPSVRLIAKRGLVSDLVGEKLDEAFVADVVARLLDERGIDSAFALLAPRSDTAGYTLFIEGASPNRTFATRLDRVLSENLHYELARRLGQLAPVQVLPVAQGAAETYIERMCHEQRQRRGDVKPLSLSPLSGWSAWFEHQADDQTCHAAK